jgi:hypothetical protein
VVTSAGAVVGATSDVLLGIDADSGGPTLAIVVLGSTWDGAGTGSEKAVVGCGSNSVATPI